jgi:predicted small lipoprotein YifL
MSAQSRNPLPHWKRGSYFGRARRRLTPTLILLLVALALAGCGKKGNPQPPPGEPDTYPRTYPSA